MNHRVSKVLGLLLATLAVSQVGGCGGGAGGAAVAVFPGPTRSMSIALASNDGQLWVVNTASNSVSVFNVVGDVNTKLGETPVGLSPQSIAIDPTSTLAYVVNQGSDSITVINVASRAVVGTINGVGTEPHGAALTPSGAFLYVACASSANVIKVSTATQTVVGAIAPPGARDLRGVAITNDGDQNDNDEIVFVTEFLSQPVAGGPGEVFDTGREGRIHRIRTSDDAPLASTALPNILTGFTANRTPFNSPPAIPNPFGGGAADEQRAFPNAIQGLCIAGDKVIIPSIGSSPEPPVRFDVNIHALVNSLNAGDGTLRGAINMNLAVKNEPALAIDPLNKLAFSGPWACDVHPTQDNAWVAVLGGDVVVKLGGVRSNLPFVATRADNGLIRLQTGKSPRGLVINGAGTRLYVNNYISRNVTAIDLGTETVLTNFSSAALPAVGSAEERVLLGEELFSTSRGPAAPGLTADGRNARFTMSDNGFGSCFNCHPLGLSDGVTWSFTNGPRQTIPLDGTFFAGGGAPHFGQRVLNWTAVRSLVQDFEKNTENVSGGFGLIGVNGGGDGVADHLVNNGLDPRADAIEEFVKSIKAPRAAPPTVGNVANGRLVFANRNCVNCHGGPGWTESLRDYTLPATTNVLVVLLAGQVINIVAPARVILQNVASFNAASPIEIRGAGGLIGQAAQGAQGFNPPSLVGIHRHSPYFHDGRFQTLDQVVDSGHFNIVPALNATERLDLIAFLKSIDDTTPTFP